MAKQMTRDEQRADKVVRLISEALATFDKIVKNCRAANEASELSRLLAGSKVAAEEFASANAPYSSQELSD